MTYRLFKEEQTTTIEIGALRNYCSCKVYHENRTLGIKVIGSLGNEQKRHAFYRIKKLLKELKGEYFAYVNSKDLRANKFTKYLGLQLHSRIYGYNKYIWLNQ